MNKKIDLPIVIFLLFVAVAVTFSVSYMSFSGNWIALRHRTEDYGLSKVYEAESIIKDAFIGDVADLQLSDGAVSGMVEALNDRWSYYLTAAELEKYMNDANNQYPGIGITIEADSELRGIMVVSVAKNSPAIDAGILPGDVVLSVGEVILAGMELHEASEAIGVFINDGLVPLRLMNAEGEIYEVSLVPRHIEVDPVDYKMTDGNIGLISITNFEARAASQTVEAVNTLIEQGAVGLIFDVRNNRGGQLEELLKALDFILPECIIFASKTKDGPLQYRTSDASNVKMPMVVLINSGSYSAAEFFAAALSEHGWATVIGEKTTGKGYAQETRILSDGSALHISTREYFTPNGNSLADSGLDPDIEVLLTDEKTYDLYYGRLAPEDDEQLIAAVIEIRRLVNEAF